MEGLEHFCSCSERIKRELRLKNLYAITVIMENVPKCYMKQIDMTRVLSNLVVVFFKFIDTYLNFVTVGEC